MNDIKIEVGYDHLNGCAILKTLQLSNDEVDYFFDEPNSLSFEYKIDKISSILKSNSHRINRSIENIDDIKLHIKAPIKTDKIKPDIETWPEGGISVVLVCYDKYLKYLRECVKSINSQSFSSSDKKILSLDSCQVDASDEIFDGWTILSGEYKNPNPARNEGLKLVETEWVVFFDADNVMEEDYILNLKNKIKNIDYKVAILYPNHKFIDENSKYLNKKFTLPEWDYWNSRATYGYDTSSCWRTHALKSIGGWINKHKTHDDYVVLLELSRLGWTGANSKLNVITRQHDPKIRRSKSATNLDRAEAMWNAKSITILSVLAGRDHSFYEWLDFLKRVNVPNNCDIFILDNSGNGDFYDKLVSSLFYKNKFKQKTILRHKRPYDLSIDSEYLSFGRHQHIADLYNEAFSKIHTDRIFVLEDDVIPHESDIIKRLAYNFDIPEAQQVGAVGGIYRSAHSEQLACAASDKERWHNVPVYDKVKDTGLLEVGFIGAGATLYNNGAIKKSLPMKAFISKDNYFMGWDGNLCLRLRENGYKIYMDTSLKCDHLAWGEKNLKG